LVVASRYILVPEIFAALEQVRPGKGGEIQLTDALRMLARDKPMHGCQVDSIRHDAGNNLDFIKTNIHYALARDELKAALGDFIVETAAAIQQQRAAKR
jgi:UTP--glucose-1-phosphate uridylyltransferase